MGNVPLVSVCCLVYNHEEFLRDCFNGFVAQQATFPIEILVHDDASTDNSASIIEEYTVKYPDLFKPIYQLENQYSKGIDVFLLNVQRARGKYIAICEGDDYWTDPHKLQIQYDWLEKHPEYSMCCSDAIIDSPEGILDWHRYKKDSDISIRDMIMGGGAFIQTCTLFFRRNLLVNYPEECKKCHVGDYPLQIWTVLNGKVHYFAKKTGVYRLNHPNSWTSRQNDLKKQIPGWKTEIQMLQSLDKFSHNKFHKIFSKRQTTFISENATFFNQKVRSKQNIQAILSSFPQITNNFSIPQKINIYFALRLNPTLYQILRGLITVMKTFLWPTQQKKRVLAIKIHDFIYFKKNSSTTN